MHELGVSGTGTVSGGVDASQDGAEAVLCKLDPSLPRQHAAPDASLGSVTLQIQPRHALLHAILYAPLMTKTACAAQISQLYTSACRSFKLPWPGTVSSNTSSYASSQSKAHAGVEQVRGCSLLAAIAHSERLGALLSVKTQRHQPLDLLIIGASTCTRSTWSRTKVCYWTSNT